MIPYRLKILNFQLIGIRVFPFTSHWMLSKDRDDHPEDNPLNCIDHNDQDRD